MQILSLDTATKNCSVAVLNDRSVLAESAGAGDQTHAIHLIEMIHGVLGMAGLTLRQIDGFAVGRGPGSFTGLRIGISTVKALAVATGKPVVGVSNLDALAMQAAVSTNMICPLMDARKGEVYFSYYRFVNKNLRRMIPARVSALEAAIAAIHSDCVFIGEGARIYRKKISDTVGAYASFAPPGQNMIRASTIGRLGVERFKQNLPNDVIKLIPEYIRQSDAELGFGRKIESPQICGC